MSLATGCQAPPITVIGIGNPYRHDDAAGLVVLASLSQRFAAEQRIRLVELDGEPVRLIQSWEGSDTVLIIDAVRSLHPPGTIHHFRADGISGAAADGIALIGVPCAVQVARGVGAVG